MQQQLIKVFSCATQAIPKLKLPPQGTVIIDARFLTADVMRRFGSKLVVVDARSHRVRHIGDEVPNSFVQRCRLRETANTPAPLPETVSTGETTTTTSGGETTTTTTVPVEPEPVPVETTTTVDADGNITITTGETTTTVPAEPDPVVDPAPAEESAPKKKRGRKPASE